MANARFRRALGMSPWAILGLALLGVPRVIGHDLGPVDPAVNSLLAWGPIAVWLGVALWQRVPNPFLTLLAVGVAYGVLLGVTHQFLWVEAFGGESPSLGGNLEGVLPGVLEAVVIRTFALLSSVVTGAAVGAAAGAAGWVLAWLVPGSPQRQHLRHRGGA